MSRDHSSLPEKSNALRMPRPVSTHTVRPSVTGDGDDMFCLLILKLPGAIGFFQFTSPVVRLTDHTSTSPVSGEVATLRKTVSFHTIGVAPLRLGIGIFHAMFSPLAVDHLTGSPFSLDMPVSFGPRHCGQFSAESAATAPTTSTRARTPCPFGVWSLEFGIFIGLILPNSKAIILARSRTYSLVLTSVPVSSLFGAKGVENPVL